MVEAWIAEDPGEEELPMSGAALLEESMARMAQSNRQGRALATAFLQEAAAR
jgi:hypothetical protein